MLPPSLGCTGLANATRPHTVPRGKQAATKDACYAWCYHPTRITSGQLHSARRTVAPCKPEQVRRCARRCQVGRSIQDTCLQAHLVALWCRACGRVQDFNQPSLKTHHVLEYSLYASTCQHIKTSTVCTNPCIPWQTQPFGIPMCVARSHNTRISIPHAVKASKGKIKPSILLIAQQVHPFPFPFLPPVYVGTLHAR